MDERQQPIPLESLQTRLVRFATVVLCALLCSAVVGAVGVKPVGVSNRPVAVVPVAPFEPVEMVPVSEPARGRLPAPAIAATSELLRPAAAPSMTPVAKPVPPRVAPIRILRMEVTAYCHCSKCCGPEARGITASGRHVSYNGGFFVAADTSVLPFGTKLVIPGYANNLPVEVIDRGGAIKGHKLDVYYPSHDVARVWGRRFVDVIVLE